MSHCDGSNREQEIGSAMCLHVRFWAECRQAVLTMCAVVERDTRKAVQGIVYEPRISRERRNCIVQTVKVTSCTCEDVKRGAGVVQAVRVDLGAGGEWSLTLHVMLVTVEDDVDTVVVEDLLKGGLADGAKRRCLGSHVPRSMTSSDDPGSLATVNFGKVLLEEVELSRRLAWVERSIVGVRRSALVLRSNQTGSKVRLGIVNNVVNHADVVTVPHVLETTRNIGRHVPVLVVAMKCVKAGGQMASV